MSSNKTYKEIETLLTNDAQKDEHKRIWKDIKDFYSPKYLSVYLTYLQTYDNVHKLLNKDISALEPKDLYMYNNSLSTIVNQHNNAIKLLKLTPSADKTTPVKTGRRQKDTSKQALIS